jgi:hypothetical protein
MASTFTSIRNTKGNMIKLKQLLNENTGQKVLGETGYRKDFTLWRALLFKNAGIFTSYWSNGTIESPGAAIQKLDYMSPTQELTTGAVTDFKLYNDYRLYIIYDWIYLLNKGGLQVKTLGRLPSDGKPGVSGGQPGSGVGLADIRKFAEWLSVFHEDDYAIYTSRGDQYNILDILAKHYTEYTNWLKSRKETRIPPNPYGFTPAQKSAATAAGWGNDVIGFYRSGLLPKSYTPPVWLEREPLYLKTPSGVTIMAYNDGRVYFS